MGEPRVLSSWTVDEFGVRPLGAPAAPGAGAGVVVARVCRDCGISFRGHANSRYCPSCAAARKLAWGRP